MSHNITVRRAGIYLLCSILATGLVPPLPATAQTQAQTQASRSNAGGSLQPGDVVDVRIWREEDLSGSFQVDPDGFVILPLLGRQRVVGISPDSLRAQLTEEYGAFLVNTAVNVTLLRRINVLGEVRVPGQYTVDATVSVADLIARAQGLTPDANAEDIVLVRENESFRSTLGGTESIQGAGIRSGDQIVVGKRSWISRNFNSMVGIASIITNVFLIVSR